MASASLVLKQLDSYSWEYSWNLVRQGLFMDQEFGNDFLGLFGDAFRQGLVLCGSRFIYLFIFWLLYRVSFCSYFSFCDSIFVYYGFLGEQWKSSVLVELHVDDMQFYQQWNLLRLYGIVFCGGVSFQQKQWLYTFLALFNTPLC